MELGSKVSKSTNLPAKSILDLIPTHFNFISSTPLHFLQQGLMIRCALTDPGCFLTPWLSTLFSLPRKLLLFTCFESFYSVINPVSGHHPLHRDRTKCLFPWSTSIVHLLKLLHLWQYNKIAHLISSTRKWVLWSQRKI